MLIIRDNVFFSKNAISKYIMKNTSYLPKVGNLSILYSWYWLSD